MALTTSLAGRVRNTSLPKSHALLPLLEAAVNGIQAIDARFGDDMEPGRLSIRIRRSQQEAFDFSHVGPGRAALKPIVGFSVEDNGVGFTPENMTSFETLDSDHKADMGCRGVGRLLWLKAFDRVSVRSAYEDEAGCLNGRQFRFSVQGEVEPDGQAETPAEVGTTVSLDGFKRPFQQSALKTVEAIAREVFEHCIWYFLRPGGAPDITVADDDGAVSLNSLMHDFVYSDMQRTSIEVKEERFEMVSLRLKSSPRNLAPRLYWCAANRVVVEENLTNKVPGLYGRLKDAESSPFTYVCYLSSDFLDSHVRADRTAFDISERVPGAPLIEDVSMDDIRESVLKEVESILAGPLSAAREDYCCTATSRSSKRPRSPRATPSWAK